MSKYEQAKVVIYATGTSIEKYLIGIIEEKDKKIEEALLWIVGVTVNDDNAREILTEALKLTEE